MRNCCIIPLILALFYGIVSVAEAKEIDANFGMKLVDAAWREPVKDADWIGTDAATEKPIPPPQITNLYKLLAEKSKNGFLVYELSANPYYDVHLQLAINTHTGDVWDMYSCQYLSSPRLRRMQANINPSLKKRHDKLGLIEPWDAGITAACKMQQLTVKSGTDLVKLAIAGTTLEGAGFATPSENRHEMFLVYQILGKYEGTAAWLAINPWTGDVWDMNECSLFSNPTLLTAQAQIRKKFNEIDLKEYERLRQLKPYREYDLEQCQ